MYMEIYFIIYLKDTTCVSSMVFERGQVGTYVCTAFDGGVYRSELDAHALNIGIVGQ